MLFFEFLRSSGAFDSTQGYPASVIIRNSFFKYIKLSQFLERIDDDRGRANNTEPVTAKLTRIISLLAGEDLQK